MAAMMEITGIPNEAFTSCFRDYRNAGNSVLIAEGTTLKGTGIISCEVEFCISYRLSLRTLWTKDATMQKCCHGSTAIYYLYCCAKYCTANNIKHTQVFIEVHDIYV